MHMVIRATMNQVCLIAITAAVCVEIVTCGNITSFFPLSLETTDILRMVIRYAHVNAVLSITV